MPITPETRDRLTSSLAQLCAPAGTSACGRPPSCTATCPPSAGRCSSRSSGTVTSAAAPWPRSSGVDVSVASRQIAVLERLGYVERRPDPQDGRASLISLTPAGAEALAAARDLRAEWALTALAGWDEADARQLTDLLDRLVVDLATAGAPAPARSAVPTPR